MDSDTYVLDASVLVTLARPGELHHKEVKVLLEQLIVRQATLYLPTIALAEVAAAISRGTGDESLALQTVAEYRKHSELHKISVDEVIGNLAADLAAQYRIRGCDAVYAALAQAQQAVLVTLDQQQRERTPTAVPAYTPQQLLQTFV